MFSSVLVANRGEIALRIARTCRELGLRVVAVYSTPDRDSAVVRLADRAVHIGPGSPRRSYLHIPAIVEAARATGAEAVHPGYGFLSEDPDFARVCEREGLVFVGPPAGVLERLGDKATARAVMAGAGLPLLPGSRSELADAAAAGRLADEIGYPVIIKAVAGGGGRGMRVVHERDRFEADYADTRAAARIAFGDDRVYVERFLPSARHVEIQVLCDGHGNALHLGARDCSVQRKQQKLVEETPPPELGDAVVARMGEAALAGARAAGYVGAGTFEFLVDEAGDFFFMEVNCRIQVEHPVTELVTGVDLVREQLRVAAGERLDLRPEDVAPRGVALECRVNAEDPDRDFRPAPGRITRFVPPAAPFVRVDTHVHPGHEISGAYDSLLAKVAVWAPDRERALRRMECALDELEIEGPGVTTTVPFLRRVLRDPRFRAGRHDTSLVAAMSEASRLAG